MINIKIRLTIWERVKLLFTGVIDFNNVPVKESDLQEAVNKGLHGTTGNNL